MRSLSNQLSIGSDYDLSSPGIVDRAKELGFYRDDDGPFRFSNAFSEKHESAGTGAEVNCDKGRQLLEEFKTKG